MKKHVFTFMTFFVVCMTLMMVSCSDDDKELSEEILVGKWVMIRYECEDNTGDKEIKKYSISDEYDIVELYEDGTCHNYCKLIDESIYHWDNYGKWILKDDKLTLLYWGFGEEYEVQIIQLSSSLITIEHSFIDDKGPETLLGTETFTYQKID